MTRSSGDPSHGRDVAAQIKEVGARLLDRRDAVARSMLSRILDEVPGYAERDPAFLRDVETLLRSNVVMEATALAGRGRLDRQSLEYVAEHVRARIRHGLPLESLLHAYRVGSTGFWEAAMDQAAALDLSRDVTVEIGRVVFEIMDTLTTHVTETYLREESRLRARDEKAARDLVERLVLGEIDSGFPGRHPAAPSLDPLAQLLVVVGRVAGPSRSADDALSVAQRVVAQQLTAGVVTPLVAARHGAVVAVAAEDVSASVTLARARTELIADHEVELLFGISAPASGFSGVPAAFEQAELAVSQASATRPLVSLSELPSFDYALMTAPLTTRAIIAHKGRALSELDRVALMTVRETIRAFCDASMNIAQAADALHVHPNTLRHRLRRVQERTGLDPQVFTELVELRCILAARDQLDHH